MRSSWSPSAKSCMKAKVSTAGQSECWGCSGCGPYSVVRALNRAHKTLTSGSPSYIITRWHCMYRPAVVTWNTDTRFVINCQPNTIWNFPPCSSETTHVPPSSVSVPLLMPLVTLMECQAATFEGTDMLTPCFYPGDHQSLRPHTMEGSRTIKKELQCVIELRNSYRITQTENPV